MTGLDWSAAGYAGDPIPGDPAAVLDCAGRFQRTGDELSRASGALRALEAGDNVGKLVTALVHKAHETSAELELVVQRYVDAGGALSTYAPRLADAQAQARAALQGAAQARHDSEVARRGAEQARQHALAAQTLVEQQQHVADMHRYVASADASNRSLTSAKARIEQAIAARDAAGDQAVRGLEMAIGASPNDTWAQQIGHAVDELVRAAKDLYENVPGLKALVDAELAAMKWIWDHIEDISFALQILTLVLGEVPVLGEVLAALLLISKVLVFIKMAVPVVRGVATGMTTGDWKPLLQAGITLGVNVVVGKTLGRAFGVLKKAGIGKVTGRLEDKALAKPLDAITENSIARRGLVGTGMAEEPAFAHGTPKALQGVRDLLADPASHPGSNARVIDTLVDGMTLDQLQEVAPAVVHAQDIRLVRQVADKVISHEIGRYVDPIHPIKERLTDAALQAAGVGNGSQTSGGGE